MLAKMFLYNWLVLMVSSVAWIVLYTIRTCIDLIIDVLWELFFWYRFEFSLRTPAFSHHITTRTLGKLALDGATCAGIHPVPARIDSSTPVNLWENKQLV